MNTLEQLKGLFRELFQIELADLDFGLYRLFRLKQTEIEAFLERQLPEEVDRALEAASGEERSIIEMRVRALAKQARDTVADEAILADGEPNPQYAETKAVRDYLEAVRRLSAVEVSEAHRADVFNLLYTFFSRYYDAGDFIPRRFYGTRPAYAIPYNGDELYFHWANKDQYFVKLGEAFRDYGFSAAVSGGEYRVQFKLVRASTPTDNTKGDTRFFFPLLDKIADDPASQTFTVPFEYRLPTEAEVAK